MAIIRDDDAERLERIETLTTKLKREMNEAREESRVVSEQLKADSQAAASRAHELRSSASKATRRAEETAERTRKRTRRKQNE